MIPLWLITLLNTSDVGEFSYNGCCQITLKGKYINGEWVISVRVYARGFAWGCNDYHTGMSGSFKSVVRYYLTMVLNQLTEHRVEGKNDLLSAIKHNLE